LVKITQREIPAAQELMYDKYIRTKPLKDKLRIKKGGTTI